ncbi:hypothetical protein CSHISOI_02045 [Colletotrichum shisoi]|uniref:Uncharacterized protein n=1 Tax=Colletotrichum shisoi TaxID=2078593 RepID=A0A5Q4C264_9PEZI|nr:hypothetical protein CSHISOI_02045 [Colletotrichum shisoi]
MYKASFLWYCRSQRCHSEDTKHILGRLLASPHRDTQDSNNKPADCPELPWRSSRSQLTALPSDRPLSVPVVPAAVPRRANLGDTARDRFQVPLPWRPPPTLPSTHPEPRCLNSLFGWNEWRSEQRPVDRVQFSTRQLLSKVWSCLCPALSLSLSLVTSPRIPPPTSCRPPSFLPLLTPPNTS